MNEEKQKGKRKGKQQRQATAIVSRSQDRIDTCEREREKKKETKKCTRVKSSECTKNLLLFRMCERLDHLVSVAQNHFQCNERAYTQLYFVHHVSFVRSGVSIALFALRSSSFLSLYIDTYELKKKKKNWE